MNKNSIGSLLFSVALILIIGTESYLVISFKDFIIEGFMVSFYIL